MDLVEIAPIIGTAVGLFSSPIAYVLGRRRERAAISKMEAETRKTDAEAEKLHMEASDILLGNYQEMMTEMRQDITALRGDMEAERKRHIEREAELQAQIEALQAEFARREDEWTADLARREAGWTAELKALRNQMIELKRQLTRERNLRKEREEELKLLNPAGGE